jgi:hypothetical protein
VLRWKHQIYSIQNKIKRKLLEGKRARREGEDKGRSSDTSRKLCDAIQDKPHRPNDAHEEEGEADIRIEQPSGDAEKQPRRDQKTQTHSGGDIHNPLDGGSNWGTRDVFTQGSLNPTKAQEQEKDGADEFVDGSLTVLRERSEIG